VEISFIKSDSKALEGATLEMEKVLYSGQIFGVITV
jgi:hypothetical protein